MPASAEPKLKNVTILGREHLPSTGVLIIPSQLGFLDLLHLEKTLAGRRLVHLTEQGAPLHPSMKAHLHGEDVHALEFVPSATEIGALRNEIQDEIAKGSVIIYLPPETAAQTAPLSRVPGAKPGFPWVWSRW